MRGLGSKPEAVVLLLHLSDRNGRGGSSRPSGLRGGGGWVDTAFTGFKTCGERRAFMTEGDFGGSRNGEQSSWQRRGVLELAREEVLKKRSPAARSAVLQVPVPSRPRVNWRGSTARALNTRVQPLRTTLSPSHGGP
ncbi:hypothetical protein GN956_G24464 [Arapaima gigas]